MAEILYSDFDLRDDIFAPTTTVERKSKFHPKPGINSKNIPNPSNSSASKGPSSITNFYDVADGKWFGEHAKNFHAEAEAITKSARANYASDTLCSDSDLRDDNFAPSTIVERDSKFHPKPRINNKSFPNPSKSSASEGPSTFNFHNAADGEHVENFQVEVEALAKNSKANYVPISPFPDLVDDLFHQPKTMAETLYYDSDLRGDNFAPTTTVERSKYHHKPRISNKNLPNPSKSSASEGLCSASNIDDAASDVPISSIPDSVDDLFRQPNAMAETLDSDFDLRDHNLAPTTSVESIKFYPKPRVSNKSLPNPSKSTAYEGPFSTSNIHDAATDVLLSRIPDLVDDLFHQPKTMDETLYSDADLQNDNFAPTTIVERRSKLYPKPCINNKNLPNPSKSSTFESPSFASNIQDAAADCEHVEIFESEAEAITKSTRANYVEIEVLHTVEGEHPIDNINKPKECEPSFVQNDEAGKALKKGREGNKKLKLNVNNMAGTHQKAKKTISEMDDDYGGGGFKNDDMPKQRKRKLPRNSSSKSSEHENLIKSSKPVSEEPSSTVKNPTKKRLLHGSRRCKSAKRQVNKALLEIPDDELDRRQLVIKDLIRLAGFKERLSDKVATILKNSIPNKSVDDQDQDFNGDDTNRKIEQKGPRLNYHSYMRRPLQTRWSKTDTEFFYQAIKQFGTDFAMIQVLFPNRSRQQVKSKFKNEQRKHPLQIADALVHRSKDHSHFEKVIQHLQTLAEQNSQNAASDRTNQSEDEADQNKEEKMEANSKAEQYASEGGAACSSKSNDGDENGFALHSEASSDTQKFRI